MKSRKRKKTTLPKKYEKGFIPTMDGRTDLAKRLGHTYESVLNDCGGQENISYTKLVLIERFTFLEEFLRQIEKAIVENPSKTRNCLANGCLA